jgi:hypothetical protein
MKLKMTAVVLFAVLVFAPSARAKEKVWVMWGQSLMTSGSSANIPASMSEIPGNVEVWTSCDGTFPLRSTSFNAQPGFGPEVGFAYSISAMYPRDYHLIIRYAAGGTDMTRWQVGGDLYCGLIEVVRQITAGRKVKFEAILSDQGESDANMPENVPLYQGRMQATMHGLRHAFKSPRLPCFIGLVCSPVCQWGFRIAQAQLQIIATDGHARGIEHSTLPTLQTGPAANIHLTDASEIAYGQMFAYAVGQSGLCR